MKHGVLHLIMFGRCVVLMYFVLVPTGRVFDCVWVVRFANVRCTGASSAQTLPTGRMTPGNFADVVLPTLRTTRVVGLRLGPLLRVQRCADPLSGARSRSGYGSGSVAVAAPRPGGVNNPVAVAAPSSGLRLVRLPARLSSNMCCLNTR